MTIPELRKRPTFAVLTIAQQKFLEAYLTTGGDIMESVHSAYGTSGETAKRRARILVNTRHVYDLMIAINLDKRLSKEDVLLEASIAAKTSRSDLAKVKALEIVARLSGYIDDNKGDSAEIRRQAARAIDGKRDGLKS